MVLGSTESRPSRLCSGAVILRLQLPSSWSSLQESAHFPCSSSYTALRLADLPFCTRKEEASGSSDRTQKKFNDTVVFAIVFTFVVAFYLWHRILLF